MERLALGPVAWAMLLLPPPLSMSFGNFMQPPPLLPQFPSLHVALEKSHMYLWHCWHPLPLHIWQRSDSWPDGHCDIRPWVGYLHNWSPESIIETYYHWLYQVVVSLFLILLYKTLNICMYCISIANTYLPWCWASAFKYRVCVFMWFNGLLQESLGTCMYMYMYMYTNRNMTCNE